MDASRVKTLIIGVLLLALAGCSAVRLGYNNGPTLAYWWLDGYLDFDGSQADRVRAGLDDWFAWHRRTQLPEYATAIAALGARAAGPVSAEQVCAWTDEWRQRLDRATERILPAAARLLPDVTPAQWDRLARRQAEKLAENRAEFAPADPVERRQGQLRRAVERAETMYGTLEAPQRRLLASLLAESPFDADRWLADREARNADLLRTLKSLQAGPLTPPQRIDGLRALSQRLQRSPDPVVREAQRRAGEFNCRAAAELHNSTNPRQREHLRQRLASWEEDLRALAAPAEPRPALQSP